MKTHAPRAASLLFFLATLCSVHGANFDLVIRNGRIIDGTGNAWRWGDVAVKGNRIMAVGSGAGSGAREIDAGGLAVAPGFIDIHSHSEWVLLEDGNAESKIRQGVTTEVVGESTSPGPFQGELPPREVRVQGDTVQIRTLGDYLRTAERAGISVNVASYVGQGQVWECVMGRSFERPAPRQMARMQELVAEAMRDGALGLSTALMMPPSSLAATDDLVELCRPVAEHGGIYSTHIRDEGLGVFASVAEAITIAERARVPVDIIHLKIADEKYWGRMGEIVEMIEGARARGVNVQANVYPYTRGNNNLSSIIPPWAHEGGTAKMLERLKDPNLRSRLRADIENGIPGWYNHYTAVGKDWSRMLISAENQYKGMTMDRVIALRTENRQPPHDGIDVLIELLIEQNGSVSTVFAHHTEQDMNTALRQSWCSIGSDGSALAIDGPLRRGNPHPRSFGTFPRVLGRYAQQEKLLTIEEAVRKMTSANAIKAGIYERGWLRPGAFADIVIFDPEKVIDHASYDSPFHYSDGIEYVLVNGELVLEKGKHSGARPGKALRRARGDTPIMAKPKLVLDGHAGEGPAWDPRTQSLFFTGGNRITRSEGGVKHPETFRMDAGGANGLLWDKEGRLAICEGGNRRVTRMERDGTMTVLAEHYEGMKFNSPNDLAIDSKGRLYFTDPRYGPRDSMEMRGADGKLVEGVYRIDAPGKVERIIASEVDRPNGILVSADDRWLFVADNNNSEGGARKLWRFDLDEPGRIVPDSRKLLFDWKTSRGPDGLKMDTENRLYVAGGLNRANPPHETTDPYRGGIYILSMEGEWVDFVPIPNDEVTNCAFGGPDLKTLFITAGGTLWSVPVNTRGRISGSW